MTTVFEGSPKFGDISGDYARVMVVDDRVLIRATDRVAGEATTIAMTPEQARALAILGQAVTFTAADGADQDGRVIQ